jgi:hypothetical protein
MKYGDMYRSLLTFFSSLEDLCSDQYRTGTEEVGNCRSCYATCVLMLDINGQGFCCDDIPLTVVGEMEGSPMSIEALLREVWRLAPSRTLNC